MQGKENLILNGYKYILVCNKGRTAMYKKRWRCSKQSYRNCNATVFTVDNQIIGFKHSHNHPPAEMLIRNYESANY